MRVAIIGTGNIGIDLAEKILREDSMDLIAFVGHRDGSPGVARFAGRVPIVSARGVDEILRHRDDFDLLFDATSAQAHRTHWAALKGTGLPVIDLTPSRVGAATIPGILGPIDQPGKPDGNYSMVTCGGQAAVPLLSAMARCADSVAYVEVSSSIAALSAGPATRANIDDYVDATEAAATLATTTAAAKAILVLNPANPPVMMRTTVHVRADWSGVDEHQLQDAVRDAVRRVSSYAAGYRILTPPTMSREWASVTVGATGAGDYLPPFAGNLDIITSAAIRVASNLRAEMEG